MKAENIKEGDIILAKREALVYGIPLNQGCTVINIHNNGTMGTGRILFDIEYLDREQGWQLRYSIPCEIFLLD